MLLYAYDINSSKRRSLLCQTVSTAATLISTAATLISTAATLISTAATLTWGLLLFRLWLLFNFLII